MNNSKKYFVIVAIILSFTASSSFVFAQSRVVSPTVTPSGVVNPTGPAKTNIPTISNPLNKVNSIGDLISKVVDIFSYIAVIFAVLALIYVGFLYVMSQGKPDKRKDLSSWLLYIVIGVAIVISARIIVDVVINTLETAGVSKEVIESARNANK